jgi:hypothetical protein
MGHKVKVLYIAGTGRSGSTILGNVLGQMQGFFHVGEIRYLWDRSLIENRLCGCGLPFKECSLWRGILAEAFDDVEKIEISRLIAMRDQLRTRHIPSLMFPLLARRKIRKLAYYRSTLSNLYRAIQAKTGCRVIVDSSKFPGYGWLLGTLPNIDLRILHLVRDVRGVTYSWLHRTKLQRDVLGKQTRLPSFNPLPTALRWALWNETIEMNWKRNRNVYLRMRYEDFMDSPKGKLQSIIDFLQEEVPKLPIIGDRTAILGPTHSTTGNPNRFDLGGVDLVPDLAWKSRMEKRFIVLCSMLTFPWLKKYGYPIVPKVPTRRSS